MIQRLKRAAFKFLIVSVLAVLACSFLTQPIQALTPEQRKIFNNTIFYFNYAQDMPPNCGGAGTGGSGSIPTRGRDNIEKAFNYFIDRGFTPDQSAGIVANLIAESGVDPAQQQIGGGPGRGIAQWEVGGRWDTAKPVNLKDFAASPEGGNRPLIDLGLQLDYLWHELNTTEKKAFASLKAATTFEEAAVAFMVDFERPRDKDPNGPNAIKRKQIAGEVLAEFGGGAGTPTAGGTTTAGGTCAPGGGVVAGDIVKTAIGLAWPQPFRDADPKQAGRTSALTPTPAYTQAIAQFNAGNEKQNQGADCGVFVATVMRSSGADPDYPGIFTGTQYTYVTTNPSKYQIIRNPTQADLQPGDILILIAGQGGRSVGHTWIYVGPQQGGYTSASASLDSRAPNLGRETLAGFTLARPL